MPRKTLNVDWKSVSGAAVSKRMLKLKRNEDDNFLCPIETCLHVGFKSDRGLRKHVNTMHPWYFYFDKQPIINRSEVAINESIRRKSSTHNIPAYSLDDGMGREFLDWLKTPCGGGKTKKQAVQIGRRAMKFLMSSIGDTEVDKSVSDEFIDCCVGSPSIVINFFKLATEEWRLSSSAALNYMKAINDLMDFRKSNGVTDDVLRSFTVAEVYIRRGKENLSKKKKVEYSRNLDLEQLICRKSWASVEEMEQVIPYHTPKYKYVLDQCKREEGFPTISHLAFATRFIATFLFLRVKCTRPMTYQYISLQMLQNAKKNGGFIDQTAFKTEQQYAFDTLILSEDVLQVLDSYVDVIRPRLNPTCNYLLLTTNGKQYTALGSAMSLLVHQAIEKYVNPTRYRQIIESQSAQCLTPDEMDAVSKDQKHRYVGTNSLDLSLLTLLLLFIENYFDYFVLTHVINERKYIYSIVFYSIVAATSPAGFIKSSCLVMWLQRVSRAWRNLLAQKEKNIRSKWQTLSVKSQQLILNVMLRKSMRLTTIQSLMLKKS